MDDDQRQQPDVTTGIVRQRQRFGPFVLEGSLGSGAMARVYRSHDGQRPVAIKILSSAAAADPELLARFHREAAIGRRLRHRHIVAVYDEVYHQQHHAIVMELAEGPSLEALVDHQGPMPWRRVLGYGLQLTEVLGYLHEQGIIHRDIKPANIQLTAGDVIKLLDLGFGKRVESSAVEQSSSEALASDLTVSGTSLGSPAYMAPEQVSDAGHAGAASDVYGLAATMFHLLTGSLPYDGDSAVQVMERVFSDPVPHIQDHDPQLPPALDALLLWAMAKDPQRRLPDMATVRDWLERVGDDPADAAAVRRARRAHCRQGLMLITVVVCALVISGACCWWVWG